MYEGLSQDFLRIMKLPAQRKRIKGTLSGNIIINPNNIIKSSVSIVNQCSGSSEIQIGQVYIGKLNIKLRGLNVPRGTYRGREIVLYEGLLIDEDLGTYEDVKLGHFFIDDPQHTSEGVEIIAYDSMSKFDKNVSSSLTSPQTIYQYIAAACTACGVTLGMSQAQIEAMPNGNESRDIYKESDIETYRDLISWCAQTMGANALINRNGELIFKNYSSTSVDTLVSKDRKSGGKCSDFDTFYTGISMVNIEEQTTSYYGLTPDNGLTMNLGSNPLLQKMENETDAQLETKRRRILNALQGINYTPFSVGVHRPMIYDLMDVIDLSGGIVGEDDVVGCITKFEWSFLSGYRITGVGSNPALASAKSKTDKNISGLISSNKEVKETVVSVSSDVSDLGTTVTNLGTAVTNVEQTVEQQTVDISGKQNRINFDLQVPTTSSPGEVGDIWIVGTDTPGVSSNGIRLFRCTAVSGNTYTWVEYALISYGSQDIAVGSALPTGQIYFVYEE